MISTAIMHDPRRPLHPQLSRVGPTRVIDIPDISIWECAQIAWRAGSQHEGHHLVLHDDVRPCEGFLMHLEKIVELFPENPLCLWGTRTEEKMPLPGGFLSYSTFCWGGALCLPTKLIEPFLQWNQEKIATKWRVDDARLTLWCAETGRKILVPIPNLVLHGEMDSFARPGRDVMRSAVFVEDPDVEWRVEVIEVPGDPKAFIISRSMHYEVG